MFDKNSNGAWQEPEDTVRKYELGAWEECEFARRVISGAWENVWEAIRYMSQMNNTLKSGTIVGYVQGTSSGKNDGWGIWYFESGNTGSGSVTYYLDGDFTNPTISFDYDGFFSSLIGGEFRYASVGSLEVYTRTTSGSESYASAVSSINVPDGHQNYSTTLNGTFNRVGFRFKFQNWNVGSDMSPQYLFNIYNILIDGKDCIPSKECEM